MFSDKPRKRENLAIGIGCISAGLIVIIITLAFGIINWILWVVVAVGGTFIAIGSVILYKNRSVLELDTLAKYGDQTQEFSDITEKKIVIYLKNAVGSAFTAKALLSRVVETIKNPTIKKFISKNGETILNKMVIDGKIQSARKDEENHYFYQKDS
ncbi:MAG: hypothetical protein ACW96X_07555 [Promethearchaeota archaeon]|jgi:hypothetical protein